MYYRRKKSSKAPAKKSPVKGRKGKKDASEEEGEIASDDKEFDDGLDEDLIGTSFNLSLFGPSILRETARYNCKRVLFEV